MISSRKFKKKINIAVDDLSNSINQLELIDVSRICYQTSVEYMLFLCAPSWAIN